ncbi:MAG: hypothetical protein H7141_13220 [Burkholderiales bacterium]|nr:hypothetical protein [Bacteroidia bacterium]
MHITSPIKELVTVEQVDGIILCVLESETVDLNIAKMGVAHRVKLYGDKDYPILVRIKNVKHITKEAREYLASKDGCNKVKCGAIIIDSIVMSVIANFFLQINKPLVPTKLFTNKESAIDWLNTFK